MRKLALATGIVSLFAIGAWAPQAGAGTVTVTYSIGAGSITSVGIIAPAPVSGGSITVTYSALSYSSKISGPGGVVTLVLTGSDTFTFAGDVISRAFGLALAVPVAGLGTAASGWANTASAFFTAFFYAHCAGASCTANPTLASFYPGLAPAQGPAPGLEEALPEKIANSVTQTALGGHLGVGRGARVERVFPFWGIAFRSRRHPIP